MGRALYHRLLGDRRLCVVGEPSIKTVSGDRFGRWAVEQVPVEALPAAIDPGNYVAVICLAPTAEAATVAASVEGAVETGIDCPVVAVGGGVDAAAAYEAGASDVVPLDIADHADTVADHLETIVTRYWNAQFGADLIDETDEGLIVHDPETGEILACNERFYRMLGYDPEETEISLDDIAGHDEAFSRERAVSLVREAATGTPVSFDWEDPTRGGDEILVEVTLERADLGGETYVVASIRDVTDLRERQADLRIMERAFEEASIPLTLSDPSREDNPLVYVNEAFEQFTGYAAETAEGRNCRFLQGPDTDPETVDEIRAGIEAEETVTTDIRNYRADGTPFWNRLEITPIYDEDGTLQRFLGSQTDVTALRRAREVRQQLLSTTQDLMAAQSREEVARIVSEAATEILDHDLNVVSLAVGDGSLAPTAWTDRIDTVLDGPLDELDWTPLEDAFATGDPVLIQDVSAADGLTAEDYGPIRSVVAIPLGDHGVLSVEATETAAFEEEELDRAQLLTVNAASALDRVARREELERYEMLFETVRDKLYVIDREGTIRLVTEPLAETLGYDRETLRGAHVSEVLTEQTVEDGEALILDLIVTPDSVSSIYEGALVRRDGTEIPVEIELSLLPYDDDFRGTVGAVRDISERQQREQELQGFREAITAAGIGLAMFDASGQFEYINDRYARMLGRTREAARSVPVWETLAGIDEGRFDAYWGSFTPGETRTDKTELRRADHSTVPVETVTTAVEIDGQVHHVMTVREVTSRQERRQQSAVLHRIMRHNLRNELTVLLGYTGHLVKKLDGQEREAAEKIRETVDRLLGFTSATQDAEKLIGREVTRKPINVAELLQEAVADLRADHEVTVETDLQESSYVLADHPLVLAIKHLLTNAVEHNDGATHWVRVSTFPTADRSGWVTVEIADDGPGIPEHETAVLTAGEETSLQHGSGIGLWIVHWVVTRYGGELEFREREGGGSVVQIKLPGADASTDEVVAEASLESDARQ